MANGNEPNAQTLEEIGENPVKAAFAIVAVVLAIVGVVSLARYIIERTGPVPSIRQECEQPACETADAEAEEQLFFGEMLPS